MTLTPQSASPTMTGTIVLQKSGSSGAGGTTAAAARPARRHDRQRRPAARRHDGHRRARRQRGAAESGGTAAAGGRAWAARAARGGQAAVAAARRAAAAAAARAERRLRHVVGPCDIYKSAGNPCVAAHSTVRALFGAYSGKLYQVRNAAGATKDILTLTPGGFADGPLARHVLHGHHLRHHRRLRPIRQGQRPLVPGLDDGARLDVEHPVEGDQRIADAQRSQGLLALHQPRQQLLGRRFEVRHCARQPTPKGCTW